MFALIICNDDISRSPRANRVVKFLKENNYEVDTLSTAISTNLPVNNQFLMPKKNRDLISRIFRFGVNLFLAIFPALAVRLNSAEYIYNLRYNVALIKKREFRKNYNLLIVEDLLLLPFAFLVKGSARIFFDAREYYPKQRDDNLLFRLLERPLREQILRKFLPKCDKIFTVSPMLASSYSKKFKIKVDVLLSTPYYRQVTPRLKNNKKFQMVHHGEANTNRGISNMIEIVKRLDDKFTLDLYLNGSEKNIKQLMNVAADCKRVRFCKPVKFENIIPMLSKYDLGFYYLEPIGFNVTYNLPNKFFEFIQARLAVLVGPSPEMAAIIKKFKCGFISREFSISSMIETINKIDRNSLNYAKSQSNLAAKVLCYEQESKKLAKALSLSDN